MGHSGSRKKLLMQAGEEAANKNMKKKIKQTAALLIALSILACGCGRQNDGPPDSGTPEPDPPSGVSATEQGTLLILESLQGEWMDLNGSTKLDILEDQLTVTDGSYSSTYTVILKKEGDILTLENAKGDGFGIMSDLQVLEDGSMIGWEMVLDADGHRFHFMREEQIASEKEIVDLSTEMPKTIESTQIEDFSLSFSTSDGRLYGLDQSYGGASYGWQITKQEDGSYYMDFSQSYSSYMGIGFHGAVSEEYVRGLAQKINEIGLPSVNGYYRKNHVDLPGYYLSADYESGESLLVHADGNAADTGVFDLAALFEYALLVVEQE